MSTILNTNGSAIHIPEINEKIAGNFYVITADWNQAITHSLRDAAAGVLRRAGIAKDKIIQVSVPGTVELVNAAALALKKSSARPGSGNPDATEGVIVIGCVIRGDTPHFDYVCQIAAQGVADLNAKGDAAVIFGVLTVDNQQQALDRAGGCLGNKGAEAAVAAIEMANIHASV
ncbi:MAG: 6,7-dimethyl-8-ribityllumazine synthase [Muribaculaceae bacterium]|nr:6,7-dimethyl-8-ribityllumazine synthase [Muribaculaceae bacterium]MDE6532823.1 6,7-dimethyl-8-ribityllumazine synthase [Muribaculaceae bacterium]